MLMSMRFRSKEDEKIRMQTDLKASEFGKMLYQRYFRRRGHTSLEKVLEDSSFAMLN
jgi:hypothetical protein